MSSLVTLPDELLLFVLLSLQLDYKDLKRISRTCKKLHTFEQSEELDSKMFRKGLPLPSSSNSKDKIVLVEKGTKVKYHPTFENAQLTSAKLDDVTIFVNTPRRAKQQLEGEGEGEADQDQEADADDGYKVLKVMDLACYNEFATSPPCRSLRWEMGANPHVKHDQGVTVKDAVEATVKMWTTEVPAHVRSSWGGGMNSSGRDFEWGWEAEKMDDAALQAYKKKYKEDTGIDPDKKLQWRETLGDHSFWEGMDEARAVGVDSVRLVPKWFGS